MKLLKYAFNKKVSSPVYLIHFVTNLCNARCPHCFIVGNYSAKDELSLEEIEKMTKTFSSDIFNVNLTGGEPFLRDDISEILNLYAKNAGVKSFLIATNGFFAERIKDELNTILADNKGIKVAVSLSVDHIGDKHDKLRGVPALYGRVIGLYRDLADMHRKRLSVQINVTIQRDNYKDAENILSYLIYKERIHNISITLTRGKTNEIDAALIDFDAYVKINRLLDDSFKEGSLSGFESGYLSVLNTKNQISRRLIGRTITDKKFISPCFAGSLTGVLFANGDVYPCELYKEKIGNIRDFNYDFTSLWTSERARSLSKKIVKNRCFCTHECNWTTNILFNPRYFPELAVKTADLELRRIKKRIFKR